MIWIVLMLLLCVSLFYNSICTDILFRNEDQWRCQEWLGCILISLLETVEILHYNFVLITISYKKSLRRKLSAHLSQEVHRSNVKQHLCMSYIRRKHIDEIKKKCIFSYNGFYFRKKYICFWIWKFFGFTYNKLKLN